MITDDIGPDWIGSSSVVPRVYVEPKTGPFTVATGAEGCIDSDIKVEQILFHNLIKIGLDFGPSMDRFLNQTLN